MLLRLGRALLMALLLMPWHATAPPLPALPPRRLAPRARGCLGGLYWLPARQRRCCEPAPQEGAPRAARARYVCMARAPTTTPLARPRPEPARCRRASRRPSSAWRPGRPLHRASRQTCCPRQMSPWRAAAAPPFTARQTPGLPLPASPPRKVLQIFGFGHGTGHGPAIEVVAQVWAAGAGIAGAG